ncbi:hypothetical protein Tco_1027453 [Tanacetum coccineum]
MKSFNPNKTPSTNVTLVVAKINELERQILNGKLTLVDEYGKSLEMKVTNEASARKPGGFCKDDLDFYDGYEAQAYDLPEQMQTFCDKFDIRFRSRVRK